MALRHWRAKSSNAAAPRPILIPCDLQHPECLRQHCREFGRERVEVEFVVNNADSVCSVMRSNWIAQSSSAMITVNILG